MLLQKIFLLLSDKFSVTKHEIEDLFDIESGSNDIIIFQTIESRFDSVLHVKFLTMYLEAKAIKNKFRKLLRNYFWKKAIKSNCDQDLFMTPLTKFNNKFIISVLENKTIYTYRISDIVNLWMLAITASENLFVTPVKIKNPYTNIDFSKATLYNIYFKLLDTGFIIPSLINSFVKYDMDIKMFSIKNYTELKEIAILNFVKEGSILEKYEQIVNMLHDYRKTVNYLTMSTLCGINIKKKVIKKFSSNLYFYLLSKYSYNPLLKEESELRVKEKLKKMMNEEEFFGIGREHVVKYVPVSERLSERRSRRRTSLTHQTALPTPPPIPSTLRRRRRRPTSSPPPPPPPPPLPSQPTTNSSVPTLPPLNINNYMSQNRILSRTVQNETTTPVPRIRFVTSNTPPIIDTIFNNNEDILNEIDRAINDENFIDGVDVTLDIENPFIPSRQLTRTPPLENTEEERELLEPLIPSIITTNTENILNRLDSIISRGATLPNISEETTSEETTNNPNSDNTEYMGETKTND